MKKQMKKLVLAKETVRSLEVATLNGVLGGDGSFTCDYLATCRLCDLSGDGC